MPLSAKVDEERPARLAAALLDALPFGPTGTALAEVRGILAERRQGKAIDLVNALCRELESLERMHVDGAENVRESTDIIREMPDETKDLLHRWFRDALESVAPEVMPFLVKLVAPYVHRSTPDKPVVADRFLLDAGALLRDLDVDTLHALVTVLRAVVALSVRFPSAGYFALGHYKDAVGIQLWFDEEGEPVRELCTEMVRVDTRHLVIVLERAGLVWAPSGDWQVNGRVSAREPLLRLARRFG